MAIRLFNSLSKQLEDFRPQDPNNVTMYLCGPTVYDYVTIANFRTYALGDFLFRTLVLNDYKVNFVMNITDVGHLTGDNLGDADTGDDRLESTAEKEGRSARDIAAFYTQDFLKNYEKLNLVKPKKFTKATQYIQQQIDLVKKLEMKGFTYEISDGVYFDTSKFKEYGELSGLTAENIHEGARVEPNPQKRNPTDFALWKFSPKDKIRWQEWDSPWGRGFPGWHIECSAMAGTELGETLDLHIGGEDLKMIHHQNEIAQSECATGKTFVNYWLHGAFLQVDGGRMGKSLGNAYTLQDIESRGFDALSLRYFYMSAHYRSKLNFTWEALQGSHVSLKKLYGIISTYKEEKGASVASEYYQRFKVALDDDLNFPKAVSIMWDLVKSTVPESSKIVTILKFDEILGLNLADHVGFEVPTEIRDLAKVRNEYRKAGIWEKADVLRRQIEQAGYLVEDLKDTFKIKRKI